MGEVQAKTGMKCQIDIKTQCRYFVVHIWTNMCEKDDAW